MSLFCTGWTLIWLLLLPFGVFPEARWSALLPVFAMSVMMLGLEDAAIQARGDSGPWAACTAPVWRRSCAAFL